LGLCVSPSNPCLALVTLRGSYAYVVRDVTDIAHPKTVSNLGTSISPPEFISATKLSYTDEGHLLIIPLAGSPKTVVATSTLGVSAFQWSPDGTTAAYLANKDQSRMELHIVSAGNDRMVATMPGLPSVFGCESQACADGWDFHFAYSPDGRFISSAQNLTNVFRIWTADGSDVTPSTFKPFMTVWSGTGLYFRDSKGIEVFDDGTVSTFLPGVAWIRPKASPGGNQIVYETRDAAGLAHAFVVDTKTSKVRELGKGRANPAYLTSRFIWYQGERLCGASECQGTIRTEKTYIYDLQDGTETESIIIQLWDVWPHGA
jgi:WD40 repeat protein